MAKAKQEGKIEAKQRVRDKDGSENTSGGLRWLRLRSNNGLVFPFF